MNRTQTCGTGSMPEREPYHITIAELNALGRDRIPEELISSRQLIYSSPATLAYNSPGATGFGVKRAGLAIPESVMLLVAPGCCGRNTKLLAEVPGYEDRFFFLLMEESDIVNGSHLEKIPQAIREILEELPKRPSCVMICSTCVDALLGTDWERVCRKAQREAGIPVRPAYMYALTREGRKPPMVLVRKSVYSLLEPAKKNSRTVNLLGYFAPLQDDAELYDILGQMGIRRIQEISRCETFEEYKKLAQANFNLVLDAEARTAADDLEQRLKIPYIELPRLYQMDKIHKQYQILGRTLGVEVDDQKAMESARQTTQQFLDRHGTVTVAIGEMMNAKPFELALALTKQGLRVSEIYCNISPEDYVYIRHLADISPDTSVYTNLSPTMLYYDCSEETADLTIGKDAAYYHPDSPNVAWNEDRQPYGFAGVRKLFEQMDAALAQKD
jgi:nitrogenase molybdenum-cofactor synthesis protein NifE